MTDTLRFRQVHLDFHTSEKIPDIGKRFDAKKYRDTLIEAHVDSITTFSTCHHGWSYHPTKLGETHPHLDFDLLGAQIAACREADIKTPIYITAGVNNRVAALHPEWREIDSQGRYAGWSRSPLEPGFHKLCFNTAYLDLLCAFIEEVMDDYAGGDGIFLDIVSQGECCCPACMQSMEEAGLDPAESRDRVRWARTTLMNYYRRTTEAVRKGHPDHPIFHNSGNIAKGDREILPYFSHLEMESLPTGGWGYDHFPGSVKYVHNLGRDFLGMTGKFHTTWGEFGGFKHANALRCECGAMIAFGARCSIGDQLHPSGELDQTTYTLIGEAYREVAAKEAFCRGVRQISDIAVLSSAAYTGNESHSHSNESDAGAARMLLESKILFDIIDDAMDFRPYKVLILPDDIPVSHTLKSRIDAYLAAGGKLLLTGSSGLDDSGNPLWDLGARFEGASPCSPDFFMPASKIRPEWLQSPLVMYGRSRRITVTAGESLGDIHDPYFNREYNHFCSHQHAPYRNEPSGYHGGVKNGGIVYLAHPMFRLYKDYGAVIYRQILIGALNLLFTEPSLKVSLPSAGRAALTFKEGVGYIAHLLYGPPQKRGDNAVIFQNTPNQTSLTVEVIEDLPPLIDTELEIRVPETVRSVTLEPQGTELKALNENRTKVSVPRFSCHQMVVFHTV